MADTFEYPRPIAKDTFPAYTPNEAPEEPSEKTEETTDEPTSERTGVATLVSDPSQRGKLAKPLGGTYGVTRLVVLSGAKASTSRHEGQPLGEDDPIDPKPFCLAPGLDAPAIGWSTPNPKFILELKLELFSANHQAAIATATWKPQDEEPSTLEKKPDEQLGCTGTASWTKDLLTFDQAVAAEFPDGLPTARHSPYLLRATVTKNDSAPVPGYPLIAETIFHVRVSKLELSWGGQDLLPAAANGCDPKYDGTWAAREKAVLDALVKDSATPKPDVVHKVVLDAPLVSGGGINDFQAEHKLLWGEGPRVPLLAKALVRRADGTDAADPKATFGLKVLWDWEAPADLTWRRWLGKAEGDDTDDWKKTSLAADRAFFDKVIESAQRDPGLAPPGAANCPAAFGGRTRHKTADPDLPVFAGDAALDWTVAQLGDGTKRRWTATSAFDGKKVPEATGVLFSPGRLPGDTYHVRAYLALPSKDDAATLALDVAEADLGDGKKSLFEHVVAVEEARRLPSASATFRVYRRLELLFGGFPTTIPQAWRDDTVKYYERAASLILDPKPIGALLDSFRDAAEYARAHDAMYRTQAVSDTWDVDAGKKVTIPIQLQAHHAFVPPADADLADAREFIPMRDLNEYSTALKRTFKERGVWALDLSADIGPGNPEVTAGGAQGWLIGKASFGTERTYLVLSKNGQPFAKNAQLVAKAHTYDKNKQSVDPKPGDDKKATIEAVRTLASTWLEPQVKAVNGTNEREVKVTIGTRSHTVTFKRSLGSTSTKISTEHKDGLRQLLVDAVKAHANGAFVISIEGKVASTKDRKRTGGVRSLLTGFLEDGTVVDAADAYAQLAGLPLSLLSPSTYNDAWTACADFVWDALRLKWQKTKLGGKKGLIYLAFERRSQGDIHPAGASFAGDNLADLALAYSTNPGRFQKPRQGYVAPVPLLVHELGHSLFLQHATTRSFAVKAPAIPDTGDDEGHVRFSTCCMNYDPDPLSVQLCALCLGKLMGWIFSPDAKRLRNAHLAPDVNAVDDDAAIDKAITYIDEDLQTSTQPAWLHLGAAYLISRKTAVRDAMRKENKEADDKAYAYQKWEKKPRWKELKDKKSRSRSEAKEFDKLDAEYNVLQSKCALDKFDYLAGRPHQRQAAAGLVDRLFKAEEAYRAVDASFQQPLGTSMLMALAQGHYRYGDVERGHELYAKLDAKTQHRLDLGEVRWAKLPPEDVPYLPPSEVNDLATRFWHLTNKGKTSHEYKVTISLGDPDALFTAPATSAQGQAARLQVLGLHNRPLKHRKANEAFAFAWDYAETLLPGLKADPGTILKAALKEYLVEGGELPVPGEVSKARMYGGFAVNNSQTAMMIQFPADRFPPEKGYQEGKHADELPYSRYMLGGERWDVENAFHDDNPALGKLPLTIKVEKRPLGGQWAPAPKGVRVYLELLAPGKLPAPTAIANPEAAKHPVAGGHSYYDQPVAPELRANPKKYLADLVEGFEADDPGDPQAGNAHFMLGGKRGLVPGNVSEPLFSAIENVFCGTAAQGFGGLPRAGNGGVARDHQVCLETDAGGLVHLTMAPSRVGGDAYRLRAYVGPPTRDMTGTDPLVSKDETGVLVRWRTLRISRHVKVDGAANTGELPDYLKGGDYPQDKLTPHLGAVADLDLKGFLTQELARSYCELVLDPAAQTPSKLSALGPAILQEAKALARDHDSLNRPNIPNAWSKKTLISVFREEVPPDAWDKDKKVVRYTLGCPTPEQGTVTIRPRGKGLSDAIASDASGALGDLKGGLTKATLDYGTGVLTAEFDAQQDGPGIDVCYYPKNYLDLDSLLVFPDKSPFLFNLRLPEDYNVQLGTKKFKKIGRDASRSPEASGYIRDGYLGVTKNWLSQALARAGHKGYLPGLSIFQAAALDTYDGLWGGIGTQQGKGVESAILLFGKASGELYNRLALHELSHGFYLQHAPGGGATGAKDHLHAKGTGDVCVMSYDDSNDGDHCGQCVASLRGMSVEHAPFVPDDA